LEFTFLFKPESFQEQFLEYAQPGINIEINKHPFFQELDLCDVLFSPLITKDLILAPPLTWIEALSRGLPVITTMTVGIEECLLHKKSGLIFNNWAELEEWLMDADLHEELLKMHKSTKLIYIKKYCLKNVSLKYFQLYRKLIFGNGILGAKSLPG